MGSFSVLRKVLILLACCPPFLPSTPAFAARPSARGHDESATKPLDAAFAYVEGLRASREGDRERAFELLGKAAQLKPTEPFIRLEYARVAASLGYSSRSFSDRKEKLDLALEQLRAARQLASGDFPVLKEVGALMLDLARDRAEVLPAAREALEAAREVNPRDLDVVFRLGQVYGAVGEPERAVEAFRVANQMAPGLPWLQSLLAQELMNVAKLRQREEKPAEEEALLREAMAVAPEKAAPRVRLFDLLRARNDHQAAVAVLDGLSPDQLDPSSRASLALELFVVGDLARGERLIKSFEEKQPGLKPYLALYQAALGRPAEAVHTLSELIEGDSSLAGLAGSVVSALIDAERGEAAAQLADLALVELAGSLSAEQIADLRLDRAQVALDQHDAEGARAVLAPLAANGGQGTQGEGWKLYYSEALFELGKTDEALAILPEKLEEGTPESQAPQVPLVAKRAELLLRGKRDAEAEALLVPLLASNNVHVIGVAARVYQRTGRFAAAVPLWEKAVALDPSSLEAPYFLSVALEQSGQRDRALEVLRNLVKARPDFPDALNNLGYSYAERGENLQEAVALLKRAVELKPTNGDYADSLGWAHFRLGQLSEARENLERAARLRPKEPTILEHLGDVYQAMGEQRLAEESYQRALELKPANAEEVRQKLKKLKPEPKRP